MMKKRKSLLSVRFLVALIIAAVLMWMIVAGGCLHFARVKIHGNSMRIDVAVLFFTLGCVIDMLFLTKYVDENGISISDKERLSLDSFRLLI